jgi:2-dehydropantoate 2-reductase
VGGGALGRAFAAALASAGRPVTLLMRPHSGEDLLGAGMIQVTGAVRFSVPVTPGRGGPAGVGVTSEAADLDHVSGVLFATKAHQLKEAATSLRTAAPTSSYWVAGLQNGLAKDDLLAAAFGSERVVAAATVFGVRREHDGGVTASGLGTTFFGEFEAGRAQRAKDVAAALTDSGLPCRLVTDARALSWAKTLNAIGVFGVSALTRLPTSDFMREPHFIRLYLSLVEEAASVASALGVAINDYPDLPMSTYLRTPREDVIRRLAQPAPSSTRRGRPPSWSSMGHDLRQGRRTEWDGVFGDLLRRADRAGAPVPRIALVTDLLAGLDEVAGTPREGGE